MILMFILHLNKTIFKNVQSIFLNLIIMKYALKKIFLIELSIGLEKRQIKAKI